jgi:hypothetical protein
VGDTPELAHLAELMEDGQISPKAAGPRGSALVGVPLEESGLTLFAGRPIPFRERERREIEMLARVTDRTCRPARGDRIPPQWSSGGQFPGT